MWVFSIKVSISYFKNGEENSALLTEGSTFKSLLQGSVTRWVTLQTDRRGGESAQRLQEHAPWPVWGRAPLSGTSSDLRGPFPLLTKGDPCDLSAARQGTATRTQSVKRSVALGKQRLWLCREDNRPDRAGTLCLSLFQGFLLISSPVSLRSPC